MNKNNYIWLFLGLFAFSTVNYAQQFIGLGTGNYGGVTGLSLNPSSIADSRHKFDINLFSINSYFDNNLVDIKRDAFYRGQFFKSPYNNDYGAVRRDLLELQQLPANERVNAFFDTRIQAPLSAMITTGEKSAIAITFQSRAGLQTYNMARNTAQLLYEALGNPQLYNRNENNNGLETIHQRWQEVGFTYARTLLEVGPHFMKAGITGKWLMGQAGAYIQSDELGVNFNSATELSLQSPRIRYYRSQQADIDGFDTNSFFKDIDKQGFGWDVGFTYEFRGKFKNFKFEGIDSTMITRRDLNKYTFRVAAAIIDGGSLRYTKQPLTNDHSANFMNWNFSGVKANSFDEFDTAYSRQVAYFPGSGNEFTLAMPAALSANVDLKVYKGFYVNGSIYKPLKGLGKQTDGSLRAAEWFALTPRFESRAFGVYVPITRTNLNERTDVGLTVRAGPLFIGSNNLGSYLFNEKLPAVDVHAGLKIGITYGKPSKLLKRLEILKRNISKKDSISEEANLLNKKLMSYERKIDSLKAITDSVALRNTIISELAKADSIKNKVPAQQGVNIIINNYMSGPPDTNKMQRKQDTVVINNQLPGKISVSKNAAVQNQLDTLIEKKEQELKRMRQENEMLAQRMGTMELIRKQDSLLLDSLIQDRKRLEMMLNKSLDSLKKRIEPLKNSEKEEGALEKGDQVRKKKQKVENEKKEEEVPPVTVVIKEEQGSPDTKKEFRDLERSNKQLEREIERVQRQLEDYNSRVQQSVAQNRAMHLMLASQSLAPKENRPMDTYRKEVNDTVKIRDTLIIKEVRMSEPQKIRDTIRIRDSIYFAGIIPQPAAAVPTSENNRPDTLIVSKGRAMVLRPEDVSVFFTSGSAAIDLNVKNLLDNWSLKAVPMLNESYVMLSGHTDATGSLAINRKLADRRIAAVRNVLLAEGIGANSIQSNIVLPPAGVSGSNANLRRVDVQLVKQEGVRLR